MIGTQKNRDKHVLLPFPHRESTKNFQDCQRMKAMNPISFFTKNEIQVDQVKLIGWGKMFLTGLDITRHFSTNTWKNKHFQRYEHCSPQNIAAKQVKTDPVSSIFCQVGPEVYPLDHPTDPPKGNIPLTSLEKYISVWKLKGQISV